MYFVQVKLVCVSTKSDQSLSFPPEDAFDPWLLIKRPLTVRMRNGRTFQFESSLYAHANLYLMLDTGSYDLLSENNKAQFCFLFVHY